MFVQYLCGTIWDLLCNIYLLFLPFEVGDIAAPSVTPYSVSAHLMTTMNASTVPPDNSTSLCYSFNKPPFQNSSTIASFYFSAIFTPLGLLSNLVAFGVLVKSIQRTQSQSRSSFLILLGGLVVTDFMGLLTTGSIVLSFRITNFNWQTVDPNCHFCNFMGMSMVFYGLCPLLLGATMAAERFIGINRPFTRYNSLPKNRTVSTLLLVWLVVGCVALLPVVGVGAYHLQYPGSWCFFHIDSKGQDRTFSLIFSLFGLLCIAVSFLLNTVSVVTLIKMCCSRNRMRRRRDHEVEMMVQLILINVVASICWCPLLVSFTTFQFFQIVGICINNGYITSQWNTSNCIIPAFRIAACHPSLELAYSSNGQHFY